VFLLCSYRVPIVFLSQVLTHEESVVIGDFIAGGPKGDVGGPLQLQHLDPLPLSQTIDRLTSNFALLPSTIALLDSAALVVRLRVALLTGGGCTLANVRLKEGNV
jgi:hypothetical protein